MYQDQVWEKIKNIPNDKLWGVHNDRKLKLLKIVKRKYNRKIKTFWI